MKPDDFEQQLQRQTFRDVPREWRAEILRTARESAADAPKFTNAATHSSLLAPHYLANWREWLWPSPQAWAGLAAAWMVILALNLTAPSGPNVVAKGPPATSADTEMTLAAQRRELARLLDNNSSEAVPAPKSPPGPRSEGPSPSKV